MKKIFTLLVGILMLAAIPGCDSTGGESTGTDQGTTVTGPITGGQEIIWSASIVDLEKYGYTEKEYFYKGNAVSYKMKGEATEDGQWDVEEADKAPFKTRLVVRKPTDPKKFNGTVIVEWFNVSGGADGDPGFMYNYQEILREGYGWVGVSAQQVGVQGGGFSMLGALVKPLVKWDRKRYGSLSHPGDEYSYDIFTTAARIVKGKAGDIDILEGLKPERLIAYGESQSAGRMSSYVNCVHPVVNQFDGFFIHSRGGYIRPVGADSSSADGEEENLFRGAVPAIIREDLDSHTKVFEFATEGDVFGKLSYYSGRQPDSDTHHTWELAGAAHADRYILESNMNNPMADGIPIVETCMEKANNGPHHQIIKAGLHAMHEWMINGTTPPTGDPLETDADGNAVRDEYGNALGGIRSPHVDVPIATLKTDMVVASLDSGAGCGGVEEITESICGVFGETIPFSDETLNGLYKSHRDYVQKVTDATNAAVEAGFMLRPEARSVIADARDEQVPPKSFKAGSRPTK